MEIKRKIDFLKKNKLNIFYNIFRFLVCCILFFAVNNVELFVGHNTIGFAVLFALLSCGYNSIIVGVVFAVTFYVHDMSTASLEISGVILLICLALYFINKFKKISYSHGLSYILFIVSLFPYIFIHLGNARNNAGMMLSCIFALFMHYICLSFFRGTIKRGFNNKLNPDEKICGAILLIVVAFGLSSIDLYNVEIATIIVAVLSLFISYIYGITESIIISFIFGLGVALQTLNPIYISYYLCFGVVASAFKSSSKVFSSLAVIIIHIFFTLYFTNYIIFDIPTLIAIIVVSIAFIFVPKKFIRWLKDIFAGNKNKVAVRNVVKTSKDKIVKKLNEVSNVFKEMEFSFKRTLQKTLPLSQKKDLIKEDIVSSVCKDCPNRTKCLRINGEYTTQVFDSMIDAGVTTGVVDIKDVNNYLISRCIKLPLLVDTSNDIIKGYREYNILANNMDCSKVLVAEQFGGVSDVIKNMAEDVSEDINFNVELENRICEDLLYHNIFVEEVVVYEKNVFESNITILAHNDKIDKNMIEKIVSKACNTKVRIVSIEPSEIPNISVVTLSSCPNYDIAYGSATCNKAGTIVSGDTHSFIKIDNGKYMLALSDGMGSGTLARETSDLAISFIENYYKAGFDNDLILSSVNKLLSLNNEESFSAIDLCIFNFFSNTMDFIKLGTPKSYIKKKVGLETIDSSGLPIGILEEIRPHITKKYVADFDIVILLSDGVADAFGSDNLENYINNLNMINPQDIANAIITKARVLSNNVCEDDMTVLVARIFPTK